MEEFRNTGYFVNNNGDIFGKRKKLKQTITPYGYYSVCLYYDGKYKTFLSHRIIAEVYINNPFNKPHINHIDGNKLNNDYKNLEWVTSSENRQHYVDKVYNVKIHKTPNQKLTYDEMLELYNHYYNDNIYMKDLAKKYNVSRTTISRILRKIKNENNSILKNNR